MRPSKAIEIVCRALEVEHDLLASRSRCDDVVEARFIHAALLRDKWGFKAATIARRTDRDYGAVLNAWKQHDSLMQRSRFYKEKFQDVLVEYEKERS